MFRKAITIIVLIATSTLATAQSIIHLKIKSLPVYSPSDTEIYIAGSFNDWNPHDSIFKFKRDENGIYFLDLKLGNKTYQYKLTRGSWDKVECKTGGDDMQNRSLKVNGNTEEEISIEDWKDHFPAKQKVSTAGKNVHIIDTAFLIPQLKRVRRVWLYLPEGYETSTKNFPVLYMQDGQNVFDDSTSFSGEWGVDECLDSMKKKCIVVAVDMAGLKE